MALDVETPDPPSLRGPGDPGDYDAVDETEEPAGDDHRREDLAAFLDGGAWTTAFEQWADGTTLNEAQFRTVLDRGLLDDLDFYWNPAAEDVGYRAPTVEGAEEITEELDALGRVTSEVLENDYIHRDGEEFGYTWE